MGSSTLRSCNFWSTNQQYRHLTVYLYALRISYSLKVFFTCFQNVHGMRVGYIVKWQVNSTDKEGELGTVTGAHEKKTQPHEEYWWVLNWIKALNLNFEDTDFMIHVWYHNQSGPIMIHVNLRDRFHAVGWPSCQVRVEPQDHRNEPAAHPNEPTPRTCNGDWADNPWSRNIYTYIYIYT